MLRSKLSGLSAVVLALAWMPAQVTFAQAPLPPPTSPATAEAAPPAIPADLNNLVGKRVVVGRMALCIPKTFTANLTYAGRQAKVISFTHNKAFDASINYIRSMPPSTQAMIVDLTHGGLLVFEFEDGTRLDSCSANIGWNTISEQLELAPGESISEPVPQTSAAQPVASQSQSAPAEKSGSIQQCPISVSRVSSGLSLTHMFVEALTTSEFQRQVDETMHDGQSKHYVDVRVRNDSDKLVSAYEFGTIYSNKMGDTTVSATYVSQNDRSIKPGEENKTSAMDRDPLAHTGAGEVSVYIGRVRFEDGTLWQDDGSRSCSQKTKLG